MEGIEGGQPAQPKPVTNAGRQYYFVSIKVDADTGMTSAAERAPFVGLQIGLLLGKGAYGRVYKGYYHGKVVAVKVTPVCPTSHRHCCAEMLRCRSNTRSVPSCLERAVKAEKINIILACTETYPVQRHEVKCVLAGL